VTVFDPAADAVKVAVYVPSLLSVTLPIAPMFVPLPRAKATVNPPVVSGVPLASLAVRVTVLVPPVATEAGFTVTVDCPRSAVPVDAVTVIGAVDVTAWPPIVAAMVLLPAVLAVNVAVYVPSLLSVTFPIVPTVGPVPRTKATVAPPVVSGVPLASFAVRVTVLVPPIATEAGEAVTVDCVGSAGPAAAAMVMGAVEVTAWVLSVAVIVLLPAVVAVNVAE
jgi:hypothetical protein